MRSSDDDVAANVARYITSNQLVYGADTTRPSWAIPLSIIELPTDTVVGVETVVPLLVEQYVTRAAAIIHGLLDGAESDARLILRDTDAAVLSLWKTAARRPDTRLPFCVRADLALRSDGGLSVIEFNVDTRLDRGFAFGVFEYSLPIAHDCRLLINTLPVQYVERAKELIRPGDALVIAVMSERGRRKEYAAGEDYFARRVTDLTGTAVLHLFVQDLWIGGDGSLNGPLGIRITAAVPELELFGADGASNSRTVEFYRQLLEAKTGILGSPLPYADKLLLSLAAPPDIGMVAMAPTFVCGSDAMPMDRVIAGREQYVLKQSGIHALSTGSQSVVIGADVSSDLWARAVTRACSDLTAGKAWVTQDLVDQRRVRVRYRTKPRGRTREVDCFVRLSAYYTLARRRTEVTYSFAGALATAGTDEETLKRGLHNIHGSRQSTYVAIASQAHL